jgi:hypothetical protein
MDDWLKDTQDCTEKKDASGNKIISEPTLDINDAFDQIANHFVEYKTPIQTIQPQVKLQVKLQEKLQVKTISKPKQKKKTDPVKKIYENYDDEYDDEYDDKFDDLYDKYK